MLTYAAFIYTSFVNVSLVTITFAGLMINFISGFILSLLNKVLSLLDLLVQKCKY
jgi:hypothetical protein